MLRNLTKKIIIIENESQLRSLKTICKSLDVGISIRNTKKFPVYGITIDVLSNVYVIQVDNYVYAANNGYEIISVSKLKKISKE